MDNCLNCKYLLLGAKPGVPAVCRRFPPVMGMDQQSQAWVTSFPILGVPKDIWCGEHKFKILLAPAGPPGSDPH